MLLSRRWSVFLLVVAVWSWLIWPRFLLAIWADPRSWSTPGGSAFLWVHLALIATSLALGTAVGVLAVRGILATRRR